MPSDAERDALRERDPERIYLEPAPYSPEGRLWCEDDVWPLEGDGPSGVEYVRADLVRRELEAPGEVSDQWFSRLRCDWVLRHLYERGVDVAVAESVEAAFAVAALVRRELDAPADRDALWREYEAAATALDAEAYEHGFTDGVDAAAKSLSQPGSERRDAARARLDAAVRALAAAPREREEA